MAPTRSASSSSPVVVNRWLDALSFLCLLVAFILSMIVVLSGTERSVLQNAEMFQVNISGLGDTLLFQQIIGDTVNDNIDDGGQNLTGLLNDLGNRQDESINDLIPDVGLSLRAALHLPDFYNVHLLNHCSGYYMSTISSEDMGEDVTYCSTVGESARLSLSDAVEEDLPDGVTLEDLHWPQDLRDAEMTVKIAGHVASILYIIGLTCVGVTTVLAATKVVKESTVVKVLSLLVNWVAFLSLLLTSSIATYIIVNVVEAINQFGPEIGIVAAQGRLFVELTWTAVLLVGTVTTISSIQFYMGRTRVKVAV